MPRKSIGAIPLTKLIAGWRLMRCQNVFPSSGGINQRGENMMTKKNPVRMVVGRQRNAAPRNKPARNGLGRPIVKKMAQKMKNVAVVCAKNQTPPLEAVHQKWVPNIISAVKNNWLRSFVLR